MLSCSAWYGLLGVEITTGTHLAPVDEIGHRHHLQRLEYSH